MVRHTKQDRAAKGQVQGWAFGLIVLAAIVFAALHFGDLQSFGAMLRKAQPLWLVAAAALQLCTYVFVAIGWKLVLDKAGVTLAIARLIPVAVSKLCADAMLPAAGMTGNIYLVLRLVKLGIPRGTAIAALLISVIGYYAAFGLLALVMLLMLWLHGKATPLLAGVVTAFLCVALAIPSLALWLRQRGNRPLSPFLEHIPLVRSLLQVVGEAPKSLMADKRLVTGVAACNGAIFLVDAGTLQICLLALGQQADFRTAFIAMIGACIMTALVPIPMGLGSFEAGSTAMLTLLGVPLAASLGATLLLRGFTLWLPLLPGLVMMRGAGAKG